MHPAQGSRHAPATFQGKAMNAGHKLPPVQRLKLWMKAKGVSNLAAAKALNLTISQVSLMARGFTPVSAGHQAILAALLGEPVNKIFPIKEEN